MSAAKIDTDLGFLGITPDFKPCTKCGLETTGGGLCYGCWRGRDELAKARAATAATIPEAFRWARFDAPELPQRVTADMIVRARDAVGSRGVVIQGPSGKGKTSIAVCMLRAWVEAQTRPGIFRLATELASARERRQFGREAPEVREAIDAPLLVIDDLGTDAPHAQSPVIEVVFSRHQRMRPTWVTTWLDLEATSARYGDGFARRVFQGARLLTWPSPTVGGKR